MLCEAVPHYEKVLQLDRPVRLDHDSRSATDLGDPRRQLISIRHRRRQAHERHVQRRAEDDLLPDSSSVRVLEKVNLVQHYIAQVRETAWLRVDHVAKHFGCHDDDRCLTVDGVIPCQKADPIGAVSVPEVPVLLIRQGLDRRRVEHLRTFSEGQVDRVLCDDRLA